MQLGATLFSRTRKDNAAPIDKELPRPERQRGMWSFLTWSFFLANFLAATEIIGGSAHAAIVDSDHGDASHSGDGSSYSGVSQPEMQPLTLESLPADGGSHAADPKIAFDPIAGGANVVPDLMPVYADSPVAQPNIQTGAGSDANASGSSTSYNTNNNYYSSDSHDAATTIINNYVSTDSHDLTSNVTTILNTVVNPVVDVVEHVTGIVAPVIGIADATVQDAAQVVAQIVGGLGDLTGEVTSTVDATLGMVTGVAGGLVGDVVDTATHAVGGLLGDAAPLLSDLTSTVTTVADSTIHVLGNASLITGLGDVGSNAAGIIGSTADSVGSVIASGADVASGIHDLLGNTLDSLGVSSPGSLSFAAETPDTVASNDAVASTSAYSQFNLALSDTSHDASVSASTSTDTGGITTIITSAIGIGPHTADPASDTDDHGSVQSPVHPTVLDDLHSHLHLGLFG
ncbi:hypothetical protein HYPDE_37263 [Hyphomicrobium denitrificans 1NES1]|uniref:Uncharacterized protein n=2 Tax=Hyphomicrobium denitrificans TaxID=53399 RepID=N0B6C0_9HYPH|nr:hypothetical protein HYPDE_37263 [Hyphomicrobium denitrificans 1NES1]